MAKANIKRSRGRPKQEFRLKRVTLTLDTDRVLTDVPEDMKGLLPVPEQIARLLNEVDSDQ